MTLRKMVSLSTGYCKCDRNLCSAITNAILEYPDTTIYDDNDGVVGTVEIIDDRSEDNYNAENTRCCTAKLASGGVSIFVGFYADGAQTILDVLDAESTVEEWAKDWDRDGTLPIYLWGEIIE